jgi:hypothetical protein
MVVDQISVHNWQTFHWSLNGLNLSLQAKWERAQGIINILARMRSVQKNWQTKRILEWLKGVGKNVEE